MWYYKNIEVIDKEGAFSTSPVSVDVRCYLFGFTVWHSIFYNFIMSWRIRELQSITTIIVVFIWKKKGMNSLNSNYNLIASWLVAFTFATILMTYIVTNCLSLLYRFTIFYTLFNAHNQLYRIMFLLKKELYQIIMKIGVAKVFFFWEKDVAKVVRLLGQ